MELVHGTRLVHEVEPDLPCAHGEHAHEGDDHAHEDTHGPHDGVTTGFADGMGHLELKLHDDKGDLELWLYRDDAGKASMM